MKYMLLIASVAVAIAFTGCAKFTVSANSVTYKEGDTQLKVTKMETGDANLHHVQTDVTSTDPEKLPRITGSMTDIPNGKRIDIFVDKRPAAPVAETLPPAQSF